MAHGTRDHEAGENESERPTKAAAAHDGGQERMIARGGGDHQAYANQLRSQPGGMAHGAAALHAQFGNAYAMQVMGAVEGGAERGHGEDGAHDTQHGPRGTPSGAGKTPSIAEFEKVMGLLRNRYNARMQALSDTEGEVQNNPGVVPGDPGVEHKVSEPIVSGNRLLADTKIEIQALEDAKSHEKARSSKWNKLNSMQEELVKSGHILWEQEYLFRQLLKKRGFKAPSLEVFP